MRLRMGVLSLYWYGVRSPMARGIPYGPCAMLSSPKVQGSPAPASTATGLVTVSPKKGFGGGRSGVSTCITYLPAQRETGGQGCDAR